MSTVWEKFKALPTEQKAFCLFIPLILVAMLAAWYDKTPAKTDKYTQPPAIEGTDVPKRSVKLKNGTVKVIPKEVIEDAIDPLPPEIEDPDVEVTATAEVAPSEAGSKVIATMNITTGDTSLLVKENPLPLFAFESKKRIGVGYGYTPEGSIAKVYGEWGFLRVGAFHVGVQTEIEAATNKAPAAKALGLIDYRW